MFKRLFGPQVFNWGQRTCTSVYLMYHIILASQIYSLKNKAIKREQKSNFSHNRWQDFEDILVFKNESDSIFE